jgi:hypothetical protein
MLWCDTNNTFPVHTPPNMARGYAIIATPAVMAVPSTTPWLAICSISYLSLALTSS